MIREVNHRPGSIKRHRNITHRQRHTPISPNLNIIHLAINRLHLLLPRQRHLLYLPLSLGYIVKNILRLVSDLKIDNLGRSELVGDVDVELDLLVEDASDVPDAVADLACYVRVEVEDERGGGQGVLFDIDEHETAAYLGADS